MIRLLAIAGTRPEAIKLAPIMLAAARRPGIAHRLVATGQHDAMFEQVVAAFGLRVDRRLGLGAPGQSIDDLRDRVTRAIGALVAGDPPDLLLVQGDTTTALAAALAAHAAGVPVGHVEAGLRSHDLALPWPEERNRVAIDALATLLFAPSEQARANLAAEPGVRGEVHVTGNSGIDALLAMRARIAPAAPSPTRLILATCHRREAIGAPLERICAALAALAARPDVRIVVPVHANPAIRAPVERMLAGRDRIALVPPLPFPAMVAHLCRAHLILSDSGGLQEEAAALGVPLLLLRDNSERPEAIAAGNVALVGSDTARIVSAATRLLDEPAAHAAMAVPSFPYGRGDAAQRTLDAIERWWAVR